MAITFAPFEPVAPGISAGAGEASEFNALAPYLARNQQIQGQLAAQGMANLYRQYAGTGRGGGGGNGDVTNAMEFQAQQQRDLQQQAQQGQQAMLTQAEQLRLNRIQNGLSAIDDQVSKGTLDASTADNLKMQLRTGLNPLLAKQQATKLQMMQEQRDMLAEQAKTQAIFEGTRRAFFAKAAPDGTFQLRDSQTGEMRTFTTDHKGDIKALDPGAGRATGKMTPMPGTQNYSPSHEDSVWRDEYKTVAANTLKSMTRPDANGKEELNQQIAQTMNGMGLPASIQDHRTETALRDHGLGDLITDTTQKGLETRVLANEYMRERNWKELKNLAQNWRAWKSQRAVQPVVQPSQQPTVPTYGAPTEGAATKAAPPPVPGAGSSSPPTGSATDMSQFQPGGRVLPEIPLGDWLQKAESYFPMPNLR